VLGYSNGTKQHIQNPTPTILKVACQTKVKNSSSSNISSSSNNNSSTGVSDKKKLHDSGSHFMRVGQTSQQI